MSSEPQTGIGARPDVSSPLELREIGIGMLDYAVMRTAHSNAFRKLAYRAAEVCDAIVRSAQRRRREEIAYR
jgi:hypothetical protein